MKDENCTSNSGPLSEAFEASAKRVLAVDVMKYDKYLDESGLSPDQKEEFLRAAWTIMMAFVELGFDVHPVQEACGKAAEVLDCAGITDSNRDISQEQQEERRGPDHRPKRGLESG